MKLFFKHYVLLMIITTVGLLQVGYAQKYSDFLQDKDVTSKKSKALLLNEKYQYTDLDSLKLIGEKLLVFSNQQHDKEGIFLSYFILGRYYVRTAQEKKGIELLVESKNYFASKEDYNHLSDVLNTIGNGYKSLGKNKESIIWYEKSLKYGAFASDVLVSKAALINLSQAYQGLKEYEKAIKIAEEYKDWVVEIGAENAISNAYAVLGTIAFDMLDMDAAVFYYEQSYKFSQNLAENTQKANALTNLAIVKYYQDDYEGSEQLFKKALEMKKKSGVVRMIADGYLNYGSILFELGKHKEAEKYFYEGKDFAYKNKRFGNVLEFIDALKELYQLTEDKQMLSKLDAEILKVKANREQYAKELSKLDDFLTAEIQHSYQIRKNGLDHSNSRYWFYAGAIFLFLLSMLAIFYKKK